MSNEQYKFEMECVRQDLPDPHFCVYDLDVVGPNLALAIRTEMAYRRGFVQGVAAAIRAVESGASATGLGDWCNDLHLNWRGAKHDGKVEFPKEWVEFIREDSPESFE